MLESWTAVRSLRQPVRGVMRSVLVYLQHHRGDMASWTTVKIRHFAEDVVQAALLPIRANLDNFRGESKFTTWAYRFAINRAAGELPRRRYRKVSLEELQDQEAIILIGLFQEDPGSNPDLIAERRAFVERFRQIVQDELAERRRLAVVAVLLQGRSPAVVAGQMGMKRNALYKLRHDARRKIKARLQERYLGADDAMALFESRSGRNSTAASFRKRYRLTLTPWKTGLHRIRFNPKLNATLFNAQIA